MSTYKFCTANGYAGSNYDSRMTGTDIARAIRTDLKKRFPGVKFSVTSKWGMYADKISVSMLSANKKVVNWENATECEQKYKCFSFMYPDAKKFTDFGAAAVSYISELVKSYHFSDCDGRQDYFDVNFYYEINVGQISRPFEQPND